MLGKGNFWPTLVLSDISQKSALSLFVNNGYLSSCKKLELPDDPVPSEPRFWANFSHH